MHRAQPKRVQLGRAKCPWFRERSIIRHAPNAAKSPAPLSFVLFSFTSFSSESLPLFHIPPSLSLSLLAPMAHLPSPMLLFSFLSLLFLPSLLHAADHNAAVVSLHELKFGHGGVSSKSDTHMPSNSLPSYGYMQLLPLQISHAYLCVNQWRIIYCKYMISPTPTKVSKLLVYISSNWT